LDEFLTATITGLATAGIFAIAASGLVLTYTTTGIFNFAHGAVGMLAAFAYWQLLDWGLPIWAAVALVLLVIAPGFGAAIERFIMRGLNNATETARLVVSVALLAASLALAMWIWPPDAARPLARFFVGKSVSIAGVPISWHEVLAFVLAVVVAIGLAILLRGTRTGITMRAVVDDRGLASLNGARPDRAAMLAWALGCSLAALAGILLAPMQQLAHLPLTLLIVNAYAAAMLGRLRNLPLTFVGAVLLGLLDSYAFTYRPEEGTLGDLFLSFRPAIPVLVLFLVLVLLPSARLRTSAGIRRLAAPRPTWPGSIFMAVAIVAAGAVLATGLSDADSLRAAKAVGLGLVALSLVPLVGWAGQMCLCQMSFAAIGAITVGHVGHGGNPWAIPLGMIIAALVGALVALPAVRLTGIELALATAAFAVILDRWIFNTPDIELLGFTLGSFDRDSLPLDRLHLPGVGQLSTGELLFVMTVAFALVHLLLVAVRRSTFGDRLLALRESPAACATLGLDPAATRLAVFSFSAGLAAFGGGLYASTLGSTTPSAFDLFQSLPLLLVTVAGGVASSGGAVFATVVLGAMPAVALTFTAISGVIGLLPGTMGITLGRNPDGIVTDLRERTMAVWRSPAVLAAVVAVEVALTALWLNGAISGWWGSVAVFLVPFLAARLVSRGAPAGAATASITALDPLVELEGIEHRPLTGADIAAIDRALGLDEVAAPA
jgi:branched-chain amino acid transport system permease protein